MWFFRETNQEEQHVEEELFAKPADLFKYIQNASWRILVYIHTSSTNQNQVVLDAEAFVRGLAYISIYVSVKFIQQKQFR